MSERKGAFYTGIYRNVFAEFGYSQEEIEQRLTETWEALFGDNEATKIYYECGSHGGYLLDTGNYDVRTEGMSYGMMMAVQMNKKEVFDRLWWWSKTYMYMTEGPNAGYFAWSCNPDGTKRSDGPAPDGEEFFAMALFFAANRWGDGPTPFNYSEQARQLLHDCIHNGENGEGWPMWEPTNKLIKFVPNCDYTDPSYHLPHFYELFALWANPADREFWKEAVVASREYLHSACHPVTGLAPEYAHYDGTPNHEGNGGGYGHFYSDAYRVAPNIGLDYEWFGADEWQVDELNRLQAFFVDKDPADYRRYTVEGEAFDEPSLHPVGLIATNATASLAANGPHSRKLVEMFWNTPVRTGGRRYYDNCLYLFSMLALSGHYRIWSPVK
ncbi:glycosyl hydrolase family 8 [Gorillibacterium massiliense]|uniref:glycosyl hydrolase family 8 n=1 Tax=Gorillibacterium massiliense TaxID=1280390 RepID=UPI0004AEF245|nr:glycosyl hydrolase family 8 [Gorillibacterium massiliense]